MGYLPIVVGLAWLLPNHPKCMIIIGILWEMRLHQPPTKVGRQTHRILLFAVTMLVNIMPRSLRKNNDQRMFQGYLMHVEMIME